MEIWIPIFLQGPTDLKARKLGVGARRFTICIIFWLFSLYNNKNPPNQTSYKDWCLSHNIYYIKNISIFLT